MLHSKIESLTPEQEALLPVIFERWKSIALSTEPINHQEAEAAVRTAYTVMGKPEPEIRFLSSPFAAKSEVLAQQSPRQMAQQLGAPMLLTFLLELEGQIQKQVQEKLWQQLQARIQSKTWQKSKAWVGLIWISPNQLSESELQQLNRLRDQLLLQLVSQQPGGQLLVQLGESLGQNLGEPLWQFLSSQAPIQWLNEQLKLPAFSQMMDMTFSGMYCNLLNQCVDPFAAGLIDFCLTELNCDCDQRKWQVLQSIVSDCGFIFPFEKTCFVCDRPIKFSVDIENRLHAEGEPAIMFADTSCLYFYQGVPLPEKYGAVHPNRWEEEWLKQEPSLEIRRVLAQGIATRQQN